jgi:hypothetical protein
MSFLRRLVSPTLAGTPNWSISVLAVARTIMIVVVASAMAPNTRTRSDVAIPSLTLQLQSLEFRQSRLEDIEFCGVVAIVWFIHLKQPGVD